MENNKNYQKWFALVLIVLGIDALAVALAFRATIFILFQH